MSTAAATLAQLLLGVFVGRNGVVAVADTTGTKFAPEHKQVTPEAVEKNHLSGERCLGFYPLDENNCCACSCVDFDNKPETPDPAWKQKAESLYYALVGCGLAPLVELSQSGNGCHVWLVFSEPTAAWIPRAFWKAVARKLDVTFKEIYPRQDEHAGEKQIGNLVRYPLWNQSAFVDVENDWKLLDPVETLLFVTKTDASDLRMISFQAGFGELSPEPRVELTRIVGADSENSNGGVVSLRVQRLVNEPGTLLYRRWNNDPVGLSDRSKSGISMSLCYELVRSYVPTSEICAALRTWCNLHGAEKKGNRDDWINRTVAKAYDYVVSKKEHRSVGATTFRDACHNFIDQIENGGEVYVPSGIKEFDESIDGVSPGEVAIIAGRPNHGKSALGFQWLGFASTLGVTGLCISEEMSARMIGKRRLATVSSIPQHQWVRASCAALRRDVDSHHKNTADVYVVEGCHTIDRVEEVIDQFCSLYNVGLVMVDYLQLVSARKKDRYEIVTEVTCRIKQAAMRNHVAVLLLSQLNRSVEGREDNDPKLSDLRESGQIEQDADLVVFTQYPCRFNASISPDVYRLVVGKRRNGPIRQVRIETKFNPSKQIIGWPALPSSVLDL